MASPSVTYTFANSTTADATQVNTNYTDLINGMTDGTKDFSISALTCAGAATLNGNVTLGNASADDITITGSLAGTIPIKTTATYNFGDATHGLASVYLGNSTFTTRLMTGATSSWTMTLPVTAGTAGYPLVTDGAGVTSWAQPAMVLIATSTASNSSTIDFASISNSTYDSYMIVGEGIIPVSNSVILQMRVSVAASFISSAGAYSHQQFRIVSNSSAASGSTSDTAINVTSSGDGISNSTSAGLSFRMMFYKPGQTTTVKRATWEAMYQGSAPISLVGGSQYLTSGNAVDGFRFYMSSGNINIGTFKLYGLK